MSVRWNRLVWVLAALVIPAVAPGETVKLKDQSTVRGRLVEVRGDSLVFRSSFGTLRLHRDQVVSIVFDDSAAAAIVTAVPAVPAKPPSGKSRIEVVFKDRDLSSKIGIELKKNWDDHVRANQIITELYVDGRVAYSTVDSTTDKRIYHGHTTVMKNDVELADFGVDVPSGIHHARLVVRNAGGATHRQFFEPEPLDKVLALDNLELAPGEIYRVHVAISKGNFKVYQ
jgi:hypothetical protein